MVIHKNIGSKYHERLSVMYRIVYFLLYLLIVDDSSKKTKDVSIMKDMRCIVYFLSHASFDC